MTEGCKFSRWNDCEIFTCENHESPLAGGHTIYEFDGGYYGNKEYLDDGE